MKYMRAMYRVWGKYGHRQKASWQKSVKFTTKDGYTIETWCFDRTGTHDYVDMEVIADSVSHADLYEEMQIQLDDGVFECCEYGKVEKLTYSYYWTNGCPTNKTFNKTVANYEEILNCYAFDGGMIAYCDGKTHCYVPVFNGNRFTFKKEVLK